MAEPTAVGRKTGLSRRSTPTTIFVPVSNWTAAGETWVALELLK